MSLSLNTYAAGDTDYIAKLNADNAAIATAVNTLESLVRGVSGIAAANVPKGLQYIFDRKGIIGQGSYKPQAGTLAGPNYNLTVAKGGFWDGGALAFSDVSQTISMAAKSTGTYYLTVDTAGGVKANATAGTGTVWQFAYNSTTHEVSDVALYSGVAVLFDGADYADALTSAQMGLTFQSLAERLEEIEARLVEMGAYYQYDEATTSGLDFGYRAGQVRNDNVVWSTSAGTVTLADNATNYVEVNPADGAVSANSSGFTAGCIPLYEVVTAAGAITSALDRRTWALAGGGGGGGGHTQNTDIGTTAATFKLNMDETGAPSENCEIKVERGTLPDVGLRWNEAEDKWQFTNDGVTYQDMFDASVQLATQEFSQYVGKATPDEALYQTGRGSSTAYEEIDLSGLVSAPNGLHAVVLRVFFWDSAPATDVNVKFRGKNAGGSPAAAYTVWSNQYGPATLILPIVDEAAVEYYVSASGASTANVRVFLAGYFRKVTGVGTVHKETTQTGIAVAAGGSTTVNITGCCNRGLAHYLKVSETGGSLAGTYDVEFYADDGFTALLYRAAGIYPSADYEDMLPFWLQDTDQTSEIHLKITNHDATNAGVFTVAVQYEQFA